MTDVIVGQAPAQMTDNPVDNLLAETARMELLVQWNAAVQQVEACKSIINAERELRKQVSKLFFPEPKEGTNSFKLPADYLLKMTYPIDRKVDPGALQGLKEEFIKMNISADKLVEYKPSLVLDEYRTLTAEEQHLFDQALIVKPGSLSMEIVLPSKAKKGAK